MFTGTVAGTVVTTRKDARLQGIPLLLLRPLEEGKRTRLLVACDATRQAGVGDFVTYVTSKEAALLFGELAPPSDATITGFIDGYNIEAR
ncbi:MAG: ethanolamine utilization protein EutN [Oscillospiraceae bacterium]|jgi:microcompartment protein CcmK/EutM|nr:ethanolamine utilization protein EutN [Oscillospiraceae bacterium]